MMDHLTSLSSPYFVQIIGGAGMKILSLKEKTLIAEQVVKLLNPYVTEGHMVGQTVPGLMSYLNTGLAVVAVTPFLEVMGFAKLFKYVSAKDKCIQGYEFSSWVSKKKGVGLEILKKTLKVFYEGVDLGSDLFGVCSVDNPKPQKILIKAGATPMERPFYVPNLLEAQTGKPHKETVINLKTIPF